MQANVMKPVSKENELKAYAAHLFLFNLAQTATHAYGVTYVYLMYKSVGWTITWTLCQAFMLTAFRFGGRILLIPLLRKYGASQTAIIGLTCLGVAALGLSLAENTTWLIPLACLSAFGSATYIAVLQSGVFSVIGKRQQEGRSFAIISAINGAAVVANSIVGTLCAYFWQPQWLYVLPVIGFLAAGISLLFINLPAAVPQGCYSWRTVSGSVSKACLLANFNPDSGIHRKVIPIVLILTLGPQESLPWLAWLPFAEFVSSWVVGHSHDNRQPMLIRVVAITMIALWVLIAFVPASTIPWIITMIVILRSGVATARDARTATEVARAKDPLAAAMAFETARASGGLFATGLMAAGYLMFGGVPQLLLLFGMLGGAGKLNYLWDQQDPELCEKTKPPIAVNPQPTTR